MEKVITFAAVLVALGGCGYERLKSSDIYSLSSGPKVWVYGQVTNASTGAPLSGVAIQIDGESAASDASGTYRIEGLQLSEAIGSASLHGFKPEPFTLSLHAGANSHDIALEPQDCGRYGCDADQFCDEQTRMCVEAATLSGTVVDACNGFALEAKVAIDGKATCTTMTKSYFQLKGLTPGGPHVLAAGKDGYLTYSVQVTLRPGLNAVEPIPLERRGGCTSTPPMSMCSCTESYCQTE